METTHATPEAQGTGPTGQTYELTTIADLFRVVTMDNCRNLAADLKGVLMNVAATKAAVDLLAPGRSKEMFTESQSLKWTDDGVNEQVLKATSKDGEKEIQFKTSGPPHQPK